MQFHNGTSAQYNLLKERFPRPNGAWLFTADITFIYISIENRLGSNT